MVRVQARMGVTVNYARQHWLRLIAAESIHPTSRGYVDFSLPLPPESTCASTPPPGCNAAAPDR